MAQSLGNQDTRTLVSPLACGFFLSAARTMGRSVPMVRETGPPCAPFFEGNGSPLGVELLDDTIRPSISKLGRIAIKKRGHSHRGGAIHSDAVSSSERYGTIGIAEPN